MTRIIIFASGSGSNAENLVHFFKNSEVKVSAIFCNKPDAGVISRAARLGVPCEVFTAASFRESSFLELLKKYQPDFIILAGFLLKVPTYLISSFPNRILNLHPALLPSYGGKGMYGHHVHEAVIANREPHSGITIHLVNENYDEGRILFQAMCEVTSADTPDSLATKIHALEHCHFPQIISDYISDFRG